MKKFSFHLPIMQSYCEDPQLHETPNSWLCFETVKMLGYKQIDCMDKKNLWWTICSSIIFIGLGPNFQHAPTFIKCSKPLIIDTV